MVCGRRGLTDLWRGCVGGPVRARPGPPLGRRPGASAGPGAAQRRRLIEYGSIRQSQPVGLDTAGGTRHGRWLRAVPAYVRSLASDRRVARLCSARLAVRERRCLVELTRPRGISDPSWQAILHQKERLDRALSTPADAGAAIGAAKELCECVARVVLTERAVPYSRSDNMPKLVKDCSWHPRPAARPRPSGTDCSTKLVAGCTYNCHHFDRTTKRAWHRSRSIAGAKSES
jgi:hypothetical protein